MDIVLARLAQQGGQAGVLPSPGEAVSSYSSEDNEIKFEHGKTWEVFT